MSIFSSLTLIVALCGSIPNGSESIKTPQNQTVLAYELDIFFRSTWVGDTSTKVEKTIRDGKPAIKSVRKTQITVSVARLKPMFTELVHFQTEEGDPIELRYTYSTGLEAQEMRVFWREKEIVVERRGLNGGGAFEPTREVISKDKAQKVGGSPLDSLLLGGAGKGSSVTLSMDFESKKLEENRIEYVGDATVMQKDKRLPVLEYRVMRGKATLYKVFLEEKTDMPLRIESIDGMLMLPKKRP